MLETWKHVREWREIYYIRDRAIENNINLEILVENLLP